MLITEIDPVEILEDLVSNLSLMHQDIIQYFLKRSTHRSKMEIRKNHKIQNWELEEQKALDQLRLVLFNRGIFNLRDLPLPDEKSKTTLKILNGINKNKGGRPKKTDVSTIAMLNTSDEHSLLLQQIDSGVGKRT